MTSTPSASNPTADSFRSDLLRLAKRIAELRPQDRRDASKVEELESILSSEFPLTGELLQSIQQKAKQGISEGWLCNRGDDNARFSRVAKASPETHALSIDIVNMTGGAIEHTHPKGEVTIGFAEEGTPSNESDLRFDGRPTGWVFLPPGSRHVPTVTGGRMTLIYFLPDGAVEWHT